jgi:hypothetical protein
LWGGRRMKHGTALRPPHNRLLLKRSQQKPTLYGLPIMSDTPESQDISHAELVEAERTGSILLGVDRSFAWRLWTGVPIAAFGDHTNSPLPYAQKAMIAGCLLGAPLMFVTAIVSLVLGFGWWATLAAIPLGLVWMAYSGASYQPGRSNTIVLITTLIVGVLGFTDAVSMSVVKPATYLLVSLMLQRGTYLLSLGFTRALVLQSEAAFHWLREGLTIVRARAI